MTARERLQWQKDAACARENIAAQECRIADAHASINFWRARLCECEAALNGVVMPICESCGG